MESVGRTGETVDVPGGGDRGACVAKGEPASLLFRAAGDPTVDCTPGQIRFRGGRVVGKDRSSHDGDARGAAPGVHGVELLLDGFGGAPLVDIVDPRQD